MCAQTLTVRDTAVLCPGIKRLFLDIDKLQMKINNTAIFVQEMTQLAAPPLTGIHTPIKGSSQHGSFPFPDKPVPQAVPYVSVTCSVSCLLVHTREKFWVLD